MKEIFDIKRFGKYFRYDLSHAVSNYWMTALILGFWPFIWLVFSRLFAVIFGYDGSTGDFFYQSWPFILMIIVCMSFGARVYGGVTDRKKGTDWIAIPASSLEKTLSLLLITCIILPAVLFVLIILSNSLVSLFVPDFGSVLPFGKINEYVHFGEDEFFNIPLVAWMNWCENILAFTLGALCFKRNKVGKTILCYIAFGVLIGILMMLIFHTTSIDDDTIERLLGDFDATRAQTLINVGLNLIYGVVFAALIGGIWARIKTIKA